MWGLDLSGGMASSPGLPSCHDSCHDLPLATTLRGRRCQAATGRGRLPGGETLSPADPPASANDSSALESRRWVWSGGQAQPLLPAVGICPLCPGSGDAAESGRLPPGFVPCLPLPETQQALEPQHQACHSFPCCPVSSQRGSCRHRPGQGQVTQGTAPLPTASSPGHLCSPRGRKKTCRKLCNTQASPWPLWEARRGVDFIPRHLGAGWKSQGVGRLSKTLPPPSPVAPRGRGSRSPAQLRRGLPQGTVGEPL